MSKFTLTDYTLFSAVFLQTQVVNAQVQYFDIEPDVVLDEDNASYLLDIDLDGNIDLKFGHSEGYYNSYWGYVPRYFDIVFAGALDIGNWIAGSYASAGGSGSTYYTYRPYRLPFGYPIGVLLSFHEEDDQYVSLVVVSPSGDIIKDKGNWTEGAEGYFGIRMEREAHYYYGWLRATVADSAKSITIHDYAYETIADQSIIAGDTLGTTAIHETSSPLFEINCDGTTLFIHTNIAVNAGNAELIIYDLSGKCVYSKQLSGGNQSIQLTLQTGIYIATCKYNGDIITKTISIL
jgi:hypothetical protein